MPCFRLLIEFVELGSGIGVEKGKSTLRVAASCQVKQGPHVSTAAAIHFTLPLPPSPSSFPFSSFLFSSKVLFFSSLDKNTIISTKIRAFRRPISHQPEYSRPEFSSGVPT